MSAVPPTDARYMAALGGIAIAAASLEYAMHRAIVACIGDVRVAPLLNDKGPNALREHFVRLFCDRPNILALSEEIRRLLEKRNEIIHSHAVFRFEESASGPSVHWELQNRKKPGHKIPLPTIDELNRLWEKMGLVLLRVQEAEWAVENSSPGSTSAS